MKRRTGPGWHIECDASLTESRCGAQLRIFLGPIQDSAPAGNMLAATCPLLAVRHRPRPELPPAGLGGSSWPVSTGMA